MSERVLKRLYKLSPFPKWLVILSIVFSLFLLATTLAWVSSDFHSLNGWLSFLGPLVIAGGLLTLGWRLLQRERPPRWLGLLLVSAAVIRLAAGMLWYVTLPAMGHASPAEKAGYVMADAYARDQEAWRVARSEQPLWSVILTNRTGADQYGGMLLLSAWFYRYLGAATHLPLMIVIITAAFSSLAILFTWAFTRRIWNDAEQESCQAALFAAWFLALYPDAILLGSSQMREAFSIPLVMMSFYGLALYVQEHSRTGLVWMITPVLLNLPFSPPFAVLTLILLTVVALGMGARVFQVRSIPRRWLWLAVGALALVVLLGAWFTLRKFTPERIDDPLAVISWWLRKSADWQAYQSKHASGWMQKIFHATPLWSHVPMLLIYGMAQPFLPAALMVSSIAPIWNWIIIWRAAGWTVLVALLLYASLHAFHKERGSSLARAIALAVWIATLAAAFRAGADQWDNPRYRTAFIGLQTALAGWAWVEGGLLSSHGARDPWFRRTLIGSSLFIAWFLWWYLHRYFQFPFPVDDPFTVIGLGLCSAALYMFADWAKNRA